METSANEALSHERAFHIPSGSPALAARSSDGCMSEESFKKGKSEMTKREETVTSQRASSKALGRFRETTKDSCEATGHQSESSKVVGLVKMRTNLPFSLLPTAH